jgi:hypothetical protein
VALVGPGSPSGHYGNEIDSTDTVVRIKYVGREHLPPQEFHGHRCDISQYNLLEPLIYFTEASKPLTFIRDLKLLMTSSKPTQMAVQSRPVFELISSGPIYRTTSTSGIRNLLQILRTTPSLLRLYGYDFYSKREQYGAEMLDFYRAKGIVLGVVWMDGAVGDVPKFEIGQSFSAHDPVSNFCFAQNLYKAGLFEIEPFGASILALTPYQYVERLEELLGDW